MIIDANIILRCLLQDNYELAKNEDIATLDKKLKNFINRL